MDRPVHSFVFYIISAIVFLGRTHRFAPTAFLRLWFRFSCIVGAGPVCLPNETAHTVSSRRNVVTRDLLYSQADFNLYAFNVYFPSSLASMFFWRPKERKAPARGRSSRLFLLFVNCFAISLSRHKLVVQACS